MAESKGKKEALQTIDIQGKPYVMVHERLRYFRENYKDYALLSEIISVGDGGVVFKATILNEEQVPKATGFAMEKQDGTFINKTSHVENAETSAWGRALANFGIGIDESVASADEVANAVGSQKHPMTEKLNRKPADHVSGDDAKVTSDTTKTDIDLIKDMWDTIEEKTGPDVADSVILECSSFTAKDGKEVKGFESFDKLKTRAEAQGKKDISKWVKSIKHAMEKRPELKKIVDESEVPF